MDKRVRDAGLDITETFLPRIRSPRNIRANFEYAATFSKVTKSLQELLSKHPAEIVHVNGPLSFQAALAVRRTEKQLVWHFNDTLTPPGLRHLSAVAAERWANEIVVSADAVHEHFFDERVETNTIYAPVDLSEFDQERYRGGKLRSELGINDETVVVGTVGNLNPVKGHEYFIDALAKLPDFEKPIAAPIIGATLDSRRAYYRSLRRKVERRGLSDTVQFLGYREDVPELLADFDVFVLSSISEACPIVVLEAMAMNCPVVATNVGGVPEQISDSESGWMVPAEESNALADAIADAIRNPEERSRRAKQARDRVREVFSIETCVERHLDVYNKVLQPSEAETRTQTL